MDEKEKLTKEFERLDAELSQLCGKLEETESQLARMCDDCEEVIDVGGNEEFWGAIVHHAEWECPYANRKRSACDDYLDLERTRDELQAEVDKKNARFCELEDLLFPPIKMKLA